MREGVGGRKTKEMEMMGTGIVAETVLTLYGWVSRTVERQRAFGKRGRGKGATESTGRGILVLCGCK